MLFIPILEKNRAFSNENPCQVESLFFQEVLGMSDFIFIQQEKKLQNQGGFIESQCRKRPER